MHHRHRCNPERRGLAILTSSTDPFRTSSLNAQSTDRQNRAHPPTHYCGCPLPWHENKVAIRAHYGREWQSSATSYLLMKANTCGAIHWNRSIALLDNARAHIKRGRCKSILPRVCFETADTIPCNYIYINANLTWTLLPTTVVCFPWF